MPIKMMSQVWFGVETPSYDPLFVGDMRAEIRMKAWDAVAQSWWFSPTEYEKVRGLLKRHWPEDEIPSPVAGTSVNVVMGNNEYARAAAPIMEAFKILHLERLAPNAVIRAAHAALAHEAPEGSEQSQKIGWAFDVLRNERGF